MHVSYDTETFPNVFTMVAIDCDSDAWFAYEISARTNDILRLAADIRIRFTRMYGYNNMAFDYPLLHFVLYLADYHAGMPGEVLAAKIFEHAQKLIAQHKPWENFIYSPIVPQCDLMMLNHFDNVAKMTSLKTLEFNMRSPHLEEMPFPVGHVLALHEIPQVLQYNFNDTLETKRFMHLCVEAVRFREKLIADGVFGIECLNWNDTKIGERFFLKRLEEKRPGITRRDAYGRRPGTHRTHIRAGDVIVPWLKFDRPELAQMLDQFKGSTINADETKDGIKYNLCIDNFAIQLGQGGIHGSIERCNVFGDKNRIIVDIDVASYYPSLIVTARLFPAHIGPIFCDAVEEMAAERIPAKAAGEVVKAGTLKLALNGGAFGKTGSEHSALFDLQCMLGVTLNGQLMQCLLAERLMTIPGLQMIQMNTDGLTVSIPQSHRDRLDAVCQRWQTLTGLVLEFDNYRQMHIRDVNNYLAVNEKGKIKRKGDYDYEMLSGSTGGQKAWNRDFSALVVPKAAEAAFLHDHDPADFIARHDDAYDFLLRAKVTGTSRLQLGLDGAVLGKTVRYYVATSGQPLVKIMPPLPGKDQPRKIGLHAEGQATAVGERGDYSCSMCGAKFRTKAEFAPHNKDAHAWPIVVKNHWDGDIRDVDHRWYVERAEKLLF